MKGDVIFLIDVLYLENVWRVTPNIPFFEFGVMVIEIYSLLKFMFLL